MGHPGYHDDGRLRDAYAARLRRVLAAIDAHGIGSILGWFSFGQDHHLADETAVVRACDAAVDVIAAAGHRNVLIEIANECDNPP